MHIIGRCKIFKIKVGSFENLRPCFLTFVTLSVALAPGKFRKYLNWTKNKIYFKKKHTFDGVGLVFKSSIAGAIVNRFAFNNIFFFLTMFHILLFKNNFCSLVCFGFILHGGWGCLTFSFCGSFCSVGFGVGFGA